MGRNKATDAMITILFIVAGLSILVLSWLQPMATAERILSTVMGSAGILVGLFRAKTLKLHKAVKINQQAPVVVTVRESR